MCMYMTIILILLYLSSVFLCFVFPYFCFCLPLNCTIISLFCSVCVTLYVLTDDLYVSLYVSII